MPRPRLDLHLDRWHQHCWQKTEDDRSSKETGVESDHFMSLTCSASPMIGISPNIQARQFICPYECDLRRAEIGGRHSGEPEERAVCWACSALRPGVVGLEKTRVVLKEHGAAQFASRHAILLPGCWLRSFCT